MCWDLYFLGFVTCEYALHKLHYLYFFLYQKVSEIGCSYENVFGIVVPYCFVDTSWLHIGVRGTK